MQYLAAGDEPDFEPVMRGDLVRALEAHGMPADGTPWGWKAPPSIFLLPFFSRALPGLRFVHMLRDGRDMAYSRNQRQLDRYGEILLGDGVEFDSPAGSIAVWTQANLAAARFGEEQMGDATCASGTRIFARTPRPRSLPCSRSSTRGRSGGAGVGRGTAPTLGRWREQDRAVIAELERTAQPALEHFGYL